MSNDMKRVLAGMGGLAVVAWLVMTYFIGPLNDYNDQIEQAVHSILHNIGEDPEREGLLRTPNRVARMYAELTAGYDAYLAGLDRKESR